MLARYFYCSSNITLFQVFLWVSELLSRKQIFKASHVLNNIKLDASEEFVKIFLETDDKELRNYLGTHLEKNEKLEEHNRLAWNLMSSIAQNLDSLENFLCDLKELTVQAVCEMDWDWQCDVGTFIFFKSYGMYVCRS